MAGINELGPSHTATSGPSRGSQLLFSSRRCCYRQRGKAVCCLAEQSWKGSYKFLLMCNRAAAEIHPRIAPCFPRAEGPASAAPPGPQPLLGAGGRMLRARPRDLCCPLGAQSRSWLLPAPLGAASNVLGQPARLEASPQLRGFNHSPWGVGGVDVRIGPLACLLLWVNHELLLQSTEPAKSSLGSSRGTRRGPLCHMRPWCPQAASGPGSPAPSSVG